MEVRTYDQVDPADVLRLNMTALGFPLSPRMVSGLRRHDRRLQEFFALYGVEEGVAVGQVGLFVSEVETLEGPLRVGSIWAVATLPEHGRKGVARALMMEAEDRALQLGCVALTLGTTRTRVAHRLYRELGYEDFVPLYVADCAAPAFPKAGGVTVRGVAFEELEGLERAWRANTRGMFGFVRRQEDFLWAAVQTELELRQVHGVYVGQEPVGYVLAGRVGDVLVAESACLPSEVPLSAVLAGLVELYPSDYLRVERITQPFQVRELEALGCRVGPAWGTFMLKPLMPERDFRRLLGVAEERFFLDSLDIT